MLDMRFMSRVRGKIYDVCPKCVGPNTEPHQSNGFWVFPSTDGKTFESTFPPVSEYLKTELSLNNQKIRIIFTKGYEPCGDLVLNFTKPAILNNLIDFDDVQGTLNGSSFVLGNDPVLVESGSVVIFPKESFKNTKRALIIAE